jgi:hypothetical protein
MQTLRAGIEPQRIGFASGRDRRPVEGAGGEPWAWRGGLRQGMMKTMARRPAQNRAGAILSLTRFCR